MTQTSRSYPLSIESAGRQIEIAPMTSDDRDAVIAFIATLPVHDLLFVPRDVRRPEVIDAWMRALDGDNVTSLIAREHDGTVIGCTAIVADKLSWSRHVGQLRVLVAPAARGTGFGRALIQACFAQALERGLKKLVAQMTTDQGAAIAVFEALSFRAEALLHRQVADSDGKLHDLVVLSHDVDNVAMRHELYGLSDALDDANPR
ncbi:GNAT family N-acetyltransferase [Paraburkholderia silviterrae]|uniref:GNAT family N-acetyltransferase n=1 Tax=Paraburkholderia silviterrae TaxID=2528715 RepID=A0A4V2ZYH8_9BURK|nr:GNAT family N-acetyltransferase [Paraburkholderia silviterrae]TDG20603.1 GNAT family N-acetyltransferase [Paraburkholderia silviterrae]